MAAQVVVQEYNITDINKPLELGPRGVRHGVLENGLSYALLRIQLLVECFSTAMCFNDSFGMQVTLCNVWHACTRTTLSCGRDVIAVVIDSEDLGSRSLRTVCSVHPAQAFTSSQHPEADVLGPVASSCKALGRAML
jgi:hypothetical protein